MINRLLKLKSIKSKVVVQVTGQITTALFLIIAMVLFLVNKQISEQTHTLLRYKAYALNEKLEQRIRYLMENTILLTTNELMINALTDSSGREKYLPPLVENFMKGKDVISLDVVDYDGKAIFQTQKQMPGYNESDTLRTALAMHQVTLYIRQSDHQMVIVSPIEYYSTTQGAVIVVFDLAAIAKRNMPKDEISYLKLLKDDQSVFSHNFDPATHYHAYTLPPHNDLPMFRQLGIALEIGIPETVYQKPIKDAILNLTILGLIFIMISIYTSTRTANKITQPILELYRRVKASSAKKEVLCSPLGSNDELEDLAKAFDERTLMLQYQAEHDSLTDLPNRVLFIDRLQQAIKAMYRHETKMAVLFVDLDRFKEVNDSFGHDFGDELLKIVAANTEKVLRSSDSIARLGGDEFAILLDRIEHEDIIVRTVQKIMQVFKEPVTLRHHQFFITCSIGIAVYPFNGKSPEELLKNADAAMYKAKDEGRNNYQFYTHDMTEKAYERVTLETQLRQGITNAEFELYFQPQVDMRTGDIVGMEGLVRWRHPEMGLVSPAKFIPLAEETGLIVEIDRWVMRTALKQYMVWKREGFSPGILSINLSMVQLNHEDFIDAVKAAIAESQITPGSLMFEVTETQIMRNPEQAIIMLRQLKALGVTLSIDDFGTGHSSLSYLKRLPVDKIKIDQSFVRDIPEDNDDMILTRAIIALSKSLQLKVIAEGVETKKQAEFLQSNGCFEAQGYLYFKPQDIRSVTKILHAHQLKTTKVTAR